MSKSSEDDGSGREASFKAAHDMETVRDAQRLSDRLHQMLWQDESRADAGSQSPDRVRITMDIPNEWLILAAWVERRRRLREAGEDRPIEATIPAKLDAGNIKAAKAELWRTLYVSFHQELHWLATGDHVLLKPQPFDLSAGRPSVDDDIPF